MPFPTARHVSDLLLAASKRLSLLTSLRLSICASPPWYMGIHNALLSQTYNREILQRLVKSNHGIRSACQMILQYIAQHFSQMPSGTFTTRSHRERLPPPLRMVPSKVASRLAQKRGTGCRCLLWSRNGEDAITMSEIHGERRHRVPRTVSPLTPHLESSREPERRRTQHHAVD